MQPSPLKSAALTDMAPFALSLFGSLLEELVRSISQLPQSVGSVLPPAPVFWYHPM
jgi:hypothetical protein